MIKYEVEMEKISDRFGQNYRVTIRTNLCEKTRRLTREQMLSDSFYSNFVDYVDEDGKIKLKVNLEYF